MPRDNKKYLKVLTPAEARKNGSKGGKASVAARKKKKEFKELLNNILENQYFGKDIDFDKFKSEFPDLDVKELTAKVIISCKLLKKAIAGDLKAFELIRDTIGEKPVETHKYDGSPFIINISKDDDKL